MVNPPKWTIRYVPIVRSTGRLCTAPQFAGISTLPRFYQKRRDLTSFQRVLAESRIILK